MKQEIENAVSFWLKYIPDTALPTDHKERFRQAFTRILTDKFTGHWHPTTTHKGSGYRSISNWRSIDHTLADAAQQTQVSPELLDKCMPRDIVMWCDPYNVTYRVGDYGTVYTVYEDKQGLLENVKKSMAERVSKSNGDFVISAYTTPVVIRSADGAEIPSRSKNVASPTKSAASVAADYNRRTNTMSPLRQVTTFQNDSPS